MTHEEAIQTLCDAGNDIIKVCVHMQQAGRAQQTGRWIPVTEKMPEDGVLVIVKTKDGAKYFGSAYEGRFMPNVECWYPLPEE